MNWDDLRRAPWPDTARLPARPPDAGTAARLGLPPTLRPVPDAEQVPVFDPAMKHHRRALRPSEPRFGDPDRGARWYAARRRALDHVLAGVAGSEWSANLMLRGSMLLSAWYGAAARDPGDLDFVLRPEDWDVHEKRTDDLLTGIARAAEAASRAAEAASHAAEAASHAAEAAPPADDASRAADGDAPAGEVLIHADGAVWSDIWTYDRVPGRRVVLPWAAEGTAGGTVQLDFVFNEPLPAEPEFTDVPRADGSGSARVLAATPELSLAWKVLWLYSDAYGEGKDLYDACLLAEHTRLPSELLGKALELADHSYRNGPVTETGFPESFAADFREALEYVEWDEFRKDRPNLPVSPQPYIDRLTDALAPTFAGL
ncbi:nucleotidyl transferase AbiEii/AbiGii toxin family protein [Actinomadura logoneensis]|uniref:Nucleotidyl transferase AbiEii/AbiGii toxin family protein n=1 Tax=Actinomadura logoneensis TaxID=2293572 RepID=A0A372JKF6_9ACTN|nr:nucleotidyl transferase AbiEii/AbiGii toxin family protein [Actinomadura logoneensis]RFU40511.1 nucleotidyl transferase AbiEii/AbiGii toxin family protein [Actinomadura logoneensis]